MKNYQKKLIVVSLLILALCFCFTACNQPKTDINAENVTLVFQNGNDVNIMDVNLTELGLIITEKTFMDEVLNTLKEKKDLHYINENGMITELDTLKPNYAKDKTFITILSSIEEINAVGFGEERTINNVKVFTTGVGIDEIPIKDNATYVFAMDVFEG